MVEPKYKIVNITDENVDEYDLFCLKSRFKEEGYVNKVKWFRKRFKEGLRIKLLHVYEGEKRGFKSRGFIEYVPSEYTWRGIEAKGWMVIHCIWVVGKNKKQGYGSKLLEECFKDAKGMNGVAVVISRKNWLPNESLFMKHGFEKADEISPLQLYVKKFSDNIAFPGFLPISKKKLNNHGKGLTILESHQCPYAYNSVKIIKQMTESAKIQIKIKHIPSCQDAQNNGFHPYGTFCVLLNDRVISYYPGNLREVREALRILREVKK
ncbi:MAG: hypothetical protein ACE5HW_04635 [Candidatus Methanofastidiosia archaeon]